MKTDPFFEVENPLEERLVKSFFDELPRKPGIYKMYGREENLLYVGKAKDLRNRLFTYRRVNSQKFTPLYFQLELNHDKQLLLRDYLQGISDKLLDAVIGQHIQHNRLEKFIGKLILKDMESLRRFFHSAPRRNYEIREKLELKEKLIPQEKLDDYLVRLAFME